RVRREHPDLSRVVSVHPVRPGQVQALPPGLLLGGRGGHDDGRYDDLRLFRPHPRARLRKVLDHPLVSGDRAAGRLALRDGRYQGRPNHCAKGRSLLWVTILVANPLGSARGDFVATTTKLGFERGALVFAGLIALVALAHYFTSLPDTVLFWAAYVLTRPLGATLGDTLTKSSAEGGLGLGRITSSLVIAALIIVGIIVTFRWERRAATE